MTRVALRATLCSLVVLVVGGAGLFAMSSSSTTTSLVRMGMAAGVLALLATLVALVLVPRDRVGTVPRGALAALVPLLVGVGTALFVGLRGPLTAGLLAGLPWWAGALLGAALSPVLAEVRRPAVLRRRDRRGSPADWSL